MIEIAGLDLLLPTALVAGMGKRAVNGLVRTLAEAARGEWVRLAGQSLKRTRVTYIQGIQPVEMTSGVATVALVGVLPNLLEKGMPETDLHDTLLGPNVPVAPVGERGKRLSIDPKTGEQKFYRAIPFRHWTENKGAGFGKPYTGHDAVSDATALGRQVYGLAKKLAPSVSNPYGGSAYGDRLPEGLAPKLRVHHKVDIYAGMIKQQKTYERATQSKYMTFRTISTGSPGWIRPQTPGVALASQVTAYVQKMAPQAFAAYIAELK